MSENFCCFTFLSILWVVSVLDFDCFTECVLVSHCCFNFYIPDDTWYTFFVYLLTGLYFILILKSLIITKFLPIWIIVLYYVHLLKIFSSNASLASCSFQLLTLFSIGVKVVILIKISLTFFTWTVTFLCLLVYFVVGFTAQFKFPLPPLFQVLPVPLPLPTIHSFSTVSLQIQAGLPWISVNYGESSCCEPRGFLLSTLDEAIL